MVRATTSETIAVPPAFEPTASASTGTNGYAAVLCVAVVMSAQSKKATRMPKPRTPLMKILHIMDRGTFLEAFLISSDI